MDQLIPMLILVAVAILLATLLVRAARQERAERAIEAQPTPMVVAPTVENIVAAPQAIAESVPIATMPEVPIEREPRPAKAPIRKVLDMIRDRDALVSAFLLREILDKPRARRRDV